MNERIRIRNVATLSRGWGTLTSTTLDYRDADGHWQTQEREVYDHGHAAAVLLHDSRRDTVILVRQFRLPVHLNGERDWPLEVCAGLLDGDAPEACASREALEETGIEITSLRFAFRVFTSPGSCTELVHCFVAGYDAGSRTGNGGGVASEGEDVEVLELPFAEAFALIASGGIVDAKTILLLQHLALVSKSA